MMTHKQKRMKLMKDIDPVGTFRTGSAVAADCAIRARMM
jgi:hypothetical protein